MGGEVRENRGEIISNGFPCNRHNYHCHHLHEICVLVSLTEIGNGYIDQKYQYGGMHGMILIWSHQYLP